MSTTFYMKSNEGKLLGVDGGMVLNVNPKIKKWLLRTWEK